MRATLILKIIILVFITFFSGFSQSGFVFQNLSKKNGLSQASVFSIAQDDSGFMWFGTRNGLNKYDGYSFKIYSSSNFKNSLISNDIRILFFDLFDKRLWLGTTEGLSMYRSETDDFVNYPNDPNNPKSLSNNLVRKIFRDSKNRLWVGTSEGLNLFNSETEEFIRFYFDTEAPQPSQDNDVKEILEDDEGQLWFGTANGLYQIKEEQNESISFEKVVFKNGIELSDSHIKNILQDKKGNFWIGTFEGGLNYWDKENRVIKVFKNDVNKSTSLSHNNIRSLAFDSEENLWVGTFVGLNFLKKGDSEFLRFTKSSTNSSGLSDKSIRSLFLDDRGSLWVGTYYGGINHLDENYNRFKKQIPIGDGLRGKVVSSFVEDLDKNLWIGTEGDGLKYFDNKKNDIKSFILDDNKNSISGNNVKQLLLDGDKLWIGTFQAGLNIMDIKTEKFQQFKNILSDTNSISSNNVYGFLKEEDYMWIATYGGGLNILDFQSNIFLKYTFDENDSSSISSNLSRVILKTKQGEIWIGTDNGLNKVKLNDKSLPESFEVLLSKEVIFSLTEDERGYIWIGTYSSGFYKLDPKTNVLENFNYTDGLPGNAVSGIKVVSETEFWISTNNGLSKFDPINKVFTNYGYSNGLENSEYNFNASFKDSEGNLLFGGLNGFTYFDPKAITPNTYIPPVVFTELRQNNEIVKVGDESKLLDKSINETESITFNYNEANFSLHFAALDYFNPKNNMYAFMLEGIDNEWNYAVGKTQATYTVQRAGDYVFKLKGGNSEGLWNPEERQLKIRVLPPPWRSWWAYVIYFIILFALALGFYRFIKLRHKLQLEKIVNQQQAELHEVKLRFFTNITHEFRTPLTLIIAPLSDLLAKVDLSLSIKSKLKTVESNAQRMLNLVNQILTFRQLATDHSDLEISNNNIVDFVKEIYLLFKESANSKNINYQFQVEDQDIQVWFDKEKIEKVIFNLLSNAFKFTPQNGNILIDISQNHKEIVILVSDSGVGINKNHKDQIFKRFYEKSIDGQSEIKGSGIGLAISKQMIELHKGEIYLAETNETKFEKGATFIIKIPKGKEHFNPIYLNKNISVDYPNTSSIFSNEPQKIEAESSVALENLNSSQEQQSLLIVEDNVEVRNYLKELFVMHYKVFTAKNGLEGLEKAREKLPDLIISDVMMPEKSGIALCHELKADFEISHIPVILLTARAASLFKIEGLEIGADDYLTKPFNPDELRLRVRNLINARHKILAKYKRALSLDPEELNITSNDAIFLEKALKIVEVNIESYEFNVNDFASELAVSRPLLFTKLKALSGQTPNNFIKSIRMKRASQLISTQKMNISEVAYKVGFKDVKYFSKCFKAQFGVPPSQYLGL